MAQLRNILLAGGAVAAVAAGAWLALTPRKAARLGEAALDQAISAYLTGAPQGTVMTHGAVDIDAADDRLSIANLRWQDPHGGYLQAVSVIITGFDPTHPRGRLGHIEINGLTGSNAAPAPQDRYSLGIAHVDGRDVDPGLLATAFDPAAQAASDAAPPGAAALVAIGSLQLDDITLTGGAPGAGLTGKLAHYHLSRLGLGRLAPVAVSGRQSQGLAQAAAVLRALRIGEGSSDTLLLQAPAKGGDAELRLGHWAIEDLQDGQVGSSLWADTELTIHGTPDPAGAADNAAAAPNLHMRIDAITLRQSDLRPWLGLLEAYAQSGLPDRHGRTPPKDVMAALAPAISGFSQHPGAGRSEITGIALDAPVMTPGTAGGRIGITLAHQAMDYRYDSQGIVHSTTAIDGLALDLRQASPATDRIFAILDLPQLVLDARGSSTYDPQTGRGTFEDSTLTFRDLASIGFRGSVITPPGSAQAEPLARTKAITIEGLELRYRDTSLFNRMLHLAATMQHVPDSSLRAQLHFLAPRAQAIFPAQSDAGDQIAQFIDNPGTLILAAHPPSPVRLMELDGLSPRDKLLRLGLSVHAAP